MTHRIGIIGAGRLGGTLGRIWLRAGHRVVFSSRHPERLPEQLPKLSGDAHFGSVALAIDTSDILLLSTPYPALADLSGQYGRKLGRKIVLDATNPAPPSGARPDFAGKDGIACFTQCLFPWVRLARVFSSVDAEQIEASAYRGRRPLAVPLASNDEMAIDIGSSLVRDAGCEPLVTGDLKSAKLFQHDGVAFGQHVTLSELEAIIAAQRLHGCGAAASRP